VAHENPVKVAEADSAGSLRLRHAFWVATLLAALVAAGYVVLASPHAHEGEAALHRIIGKADVGRDDVAPAREDAEGESGVALKLADGMLERFAPSPDPPPERLGALAALGVVLQEPEAAANPAVQKLFRRRIEAALDDMRRTKVDSGALVWKMYNHGFVVRTASVTLCFDLVRPKYLPGFALPEALMRSIVEQCDVLFASHAHADHVESFVARTFMEQGKPVIAPEQIGFRGALEAYVTRLERSTEKVHLLAVREGRVPLKVVILPGHQGTDIDNNVALVATPEGVTVAHTGDQWDRFGDFGWIDRVAERHRVDILLPNGWTWDIARMVRGFNPALVIPGHEYELGHEVEKRQSYSLSFQRRAGSGHYGGSASRGYPQPMVVMAWGERFHYRVDARGALQ
jgi:L-ascorbate metabolism protein UlaG (beta-lactamase superfamily)